MALDVKVSYTADGRRAGALASCTPAVASADPGALRAHIFDAVALDPLSAIRSPPMFFIGMGLVTIPLFLLSLTSWQAGLPCSSIFGRIPG